MNNEQLLRYAKHIMLSQLDYEGQQKISNSHALIIGAGGLGSPAALYLASSGIGKITLVDFDTVELSNLQRQIIHTTQDIGRQKVDSAHDKLTAINPNLDVATINKALNLTELRSHIKNCDVIIEASDNFESRYLTNQACVEERKPLISGAAIRFDGQVSTFRLDTNESPCYRCLYSGEAEENETCVQSGVFSPLTGIIGSMQACEALKVVSGIGKDLAGRLLLFNALTSTWKELKLKKDHNCKCCG